MKKIKDAFRTGQEGRSLGPENARRHRAANGLGRLVASKNNGEITGLNEPQYGQYLELIRDIAVGANASAIKLIRTSSEQLGRYSEDPVELKISAWPKKFKWEAGFHQGESRDPENAKLTPLMDLPNLLIDGKSIPVDNVTIATTTMVIEGRFSPPETTLTINSRPAPDNNPSGVSADTLVINIDNDGKMVFERGDPLPSNMAEPAPGGVSFGANLDNGAPLDTSYITFEPRESNVADFVDAVAASVRKTASAYAGLAESGPQNFVR